MRRKKQFRRGAGGCIFFISKLLSFIGQWYNRDELERIGIRFANTDAENTKFAAAGMKFRYPPSRWVFKQLPFSEIVTPLIEAGVRPKALASYDGPRGEALRRRFFVIHAEAPEFTIAALDYLRRIGLENPMRVFMQTQFKFQLNGKTLDINTATDGEIAQAVKLYMGSPAETEAVKKERQYMIKFDRQRPSLVFQPKGNKCRR